MKNHFRMEGKVLKSIFDFFTQCFLKVDIFKPLKCFSARCNCEPTSSFSNVLCLTCKTFQIELEMECCSICCIAFTIARC